MTARKAWIAVASAEHVRIGRQAGFMQVCHRKASPLRRITLGDRVIYYSPTVVFGGKDRLQAFTAIGMARDGAPYQVEMESGVQALAAGCRLAACGRNPDPAAAGPARLHTGRFQLGAISSASVCSASAMRMPI